MIKEAYCSYEVSKLLNEKGFDAFCDTGWDKNLYDKEHARNFSIGFDKKENWISRPTHQMAMAWLRENGFEISITFGFPHIDYRQEYRYFWSIVKVMDNHLEYPMCDPNSYEYKEEMACSYDEAVEAALKYTLENLIKEE